MTINTIIIDKAKNSQEILSAKLSNIEDINVIGCFEDFSLLNYDINKIDLIFFDITSKELQEIIEKINIIKNKNNNITFIATSYEINSELVTKTLNGGIKDFLLKPIIDNILEASIKKVKEEKENINQSLSNTICIYSNKGGVGKTSVAVNLAYEFANLDKKNRVCLLDLNYNSPDASTFLNIEPKYNIDYILSNLENTDEKYILSLIDKYKDTNLHVFSISNDLSITSKLTVQNVSKIINYLKNIFRWIIIDSSGTINEASVCTLNNSDLILLIGLMNMASIRSVQKCLELFEKLGYSENKVRLVINRYIENSEITIEDIEKTTGKNIFEKIPNNYLTLIDAINIGSAVGEINPQSNISRAYKKIAQEISNIDFTDLNKENANTNNHGIFNLLKRMGE